MKKIKIINALLVLLAMTLFSSCLKSDLDDLETYEGNDITSVVAVYHRYYDSTTIPVSGEKRVLQSQLSAQSKIDSNTKTVTITVKIPSNFPEAEKANVSANNLVVVLGISTAAVITPEGGSPTLGAPGDWSKPNKYIVKAADGKTAEWTVSVTVQK